MTTMIALSDDTLLEFKIDLQNKQVIVIQKGKVGIKMGEISVPMADLKSWGSKIKGITSLFPLDILK